MTTSSADSESSAADAVRPDRNLAMELVRVTEAAALASSRWIGRGDKDGADGAAVTAMRTVLSTVSMDGIVVIGEGEKDEAPMLFNGERVGDGTPPLVDVAVDPIDGTRLAAEGRTNALSVIAVSERGSMFDPGPSFYMQKIAVGPSAVGAIDITATPTQNLRWIAKSKGESVRDLMVIILDRPRHAELVEEVRAAGARIRMITDGDVYGADRHGVAARRCRRADGRRRHPRRRRHGGRVEGDGRRDPGAGCGPATTPNGRRWSPAATTRRRCSRPTISSAATTASSPPRGSPTARCSAACASRTGRSTPRASSCAHAPERCASIDGIHRIDKMNAVLDSN